MGGCQVLGPSRTLLGLRGGRGARLLKLSLQPWAQKPSASRQEKRSCPGLEDSDTDHTSFIFPRWLIIEAAESDQSFTRLSPFALGKALNAQIGTCDSKRRTNTVILAFASHQPPKHITAGYMRVPVELLYSESSSLFQLPKTLLHVWNVGKLAMKKPAAAIRNSAQTAGQACCFFTKMSNWN